MDMQKRMAAASKRLATIKASVAAAPAAPVEKPKPIIRVYMGGVVTKAMVCKALGLDEPEQVIETTPFKTLNLAQEVPGLQPGDTCPKCLGTGETSAAGVCYWCTSRGKPRSTWGILTARDIAFIKARFETGNALCGRVTAA